MDCRTVRTLIARPALEAADEQHIARHLSQCAACADDLADPVGAMLRRADLPLAIPPPQFTTALMARLPEASPRLLQRRVEVRRRVWGSTFAVGLMAAIGVLMSDPLGVFSLDRLLEDRLAGSTGQIGHILLALLLAAKSLALLGTPIAAVLLITSAVLCVWWWHVPRRPLRQAGALSICMLALLVTIWQSIPAYYTGVTPTSEPPAISLRAPLLVRDYSGGDVLSLWGDINIQGDVARDVVSLGGRVILAPQASVHGSILAGGGLERGPGAQIGGVVFDTPAPLAFVRATATDPGEIGPSALARLAAVMGALLVLALAVLWLLAKPHRVREASHRFTETPLRALGVGVVGALVLSGLVLGSVLVLAATLIGVVLVPALLLIAHLPFIHGIAAVGHALGRRLTGNEQLSGSVWGIAFQTVLIAVLALAVPATGLFVFYLLGSCGLGGMLLLSRRRLAL